MVLGLTGVRGVALVQDGSCGCTHMMAEWSPPYTCVWWLMLEASQNTYTWLSRWVRLSSGCVPKVSVTRNPGRICIT